MHSAISRRAVVFAAVLATVAWTGTASAASQPFKVDLSGTQQVPPVATSGTGTARLTYDPATRVVTWTIDYQGLSSPVTMAHFHDGAVGKNGPVTIWLTKRGSAVASPITGQATLTAAQAQQFVAGEWYVNVHTQNHPGGEIRGQVVPPKS